MQHRTILSAGALALALAACGGDPASAPSPRATAPPTTTSTDATSPTPPSGRADDAVELTVSAGDVSGPGRVELSVGEEVTLRVTSDVADEIHVHGYDLHQDVAAGGTAELTFTSDIPGVFEVELESSGLLLTKLEVR